MHNKPSHLFFLEIICIPIIIDFILIFYLARWTEYFCSYESASRCEINEQKFTSQFGEYISGLAVTCKRKYIVREACVYLLAF